MQRKPTRNTRGPNAEEKRFQAWLKEHDCVWCGDEGPSIVDHCRGATFKHLKTLCGHMFCLSNCVTCDTQKTIHGKRLGNEAAKWEDVIIEYLETVNGATCCDDVFYAIANWGR